MRGLKLAVCVLVLFAVCLASVDSADAGGFPLGRFGVFGLRSVPLVAPGARLVARQQNLGIVSPFVVQQQRFAVPVISSPLYSPFVFQSQSFVVPQVQQFSVPSLQFSTGCGSLLIH